MLDFFHGVILLLQQYSSALVIPVSLCALGIVQAILPEVIVPRFTAPILPIVIIFSAVILSVFVPFISYFLNLSFCSFCSFQAFQFSKEALVDCLRHFA